MPLVLSWLRLLMHPQNNADFAIFKLEMSNYSMTEQVLETPMVLEMLEEIAAIIGLGLGFLFFALAPFFDLGLTFTFFG